MLKSAFLAFCFPGFLAFGQAAAPAAAPTPDPQLSATEVVAVQSLSEKLDAAKKTLNNLSQVTHLVEAEIAKQHPGCHLDENTGSLAKDAPAPKDKPAAAPKKEAPAK